MALLTARTNIHGANPLVGSSREKENFHNLLFARLGKIRLDRAVKSVSADHPITGVAKLMRKRHRLGRPLGGMKHQKIGRRIVAARSGHLLQCPLNPLEVKVKSGGGGGSAERFQEVIISAASPQFGAGPLRENLEDRSSLIIEPADLAEIDQKEFPVSGLF